MNSVSFETAEFVPWASRIVARLAALYDGLRVTNSKMQIMTALRNIVAGSGALVRSFALVGK